MIADEAKNIRLSYFDSCLFPTPRLLIKPESVFQFFLTLTHVFKKTLLSRYFSISIRASVHICFKTSPFAPITICFWDFLLTKMVA